MVRRSALLSVFVLLICVCSALPATADSQTADSGAALLEAAQQKDLAKVKKLLAEGVDVNAKSRYGATALFFAADKGHLEMIELLLAKGAEVNVTDTFYEATPLTWALFKMSDSEPHRNAAMLMLKHKPEDSGAALGFAIRAGDLEMVKAALATGKVEADAIKGGHAQASAPEGGNAEIAAFLAEHLPEETAEQNVVELTPEQRKLYVGDFKNDDIGMKIKVWIEGDELKVKANDQPNLTIDSTGDKEFTVREVNGIDLAFFGRGGLIEGFTLKQGGQEFRFGRDQPEVAKAEEPELPALKKAERGPAIHWPAFRGANAAGIGDGQGVPDTWNGESGKNILWKAPIPGIALSSPIVWGDRIFVTTVASEKADDQFRTGLYGDVDSIVDESEHHWKVYALDKKTGKVVWQKTAATGAPKLGRHPKSSHANPSPVTDGKHVVAHFGSEGMFCYDFDGNLLWQVDLGLLTSGWFYDASYEWGFSSSPILHDGRVIVQTDIQKGSYIAAFDVKTGKELWRTSRNEIPTWGTPTILEAADGSGVDEVVTNGTTIRGYSAVTGEELWTLTPNSEVTVGTPVSADGLAYVTGGYPPARPGYAVKHGARGDLTLPEGETSSKDIAWSVSPGGTYIPSPIVYRGILYTVHNNGRIAAYDAKTGERFYRKRVGTAASYSGSPVAADGKLFVTTEEGVTYMVRAGKVFQELGSNELGEVVMTTPAISDGMMLIRGMDHLYAIGVADATAGAASSE